MSGVRQTSVYLNERDRELLAELQARTGLNRSTVFRLGLEKLAQESPERSARLVAIAEEIKKLA